MREAAPMVVRSELENKRPWRICGAVRRSCRGLPAWLLLVSACMLIGAVRWRLAAACRAAKNKSDVFALPPPDLLVAASLGHRAALADVLLATTLVQYGIHGQERRRFEFVGAYLESIFALDPRFCHAYRYADTFLVFQPVGNPSLEDVRLARRLVEMGLTNCPSDGSLWLSGGQFLGFLATQFLTDEDEKREFREAGARTLARAAELTSTNEGAQWQSLAAAGLFTREGKREAAIAFLERAYAATDSDSQREEIMRRLTALQAEKATEAARRRVDAFETAFQSVWQSDLPFVSRTRLLVLGPPWAPERCAGRRLLASDDRLCAASWADWTLDPAP
jgi:hypothetical protein